jgi:pimeloyl-ACP methyl ester carboxylesterase
MDDILDLVAIFAREHGAPERVYLTGASEGGIITALLAEENPWVFDGGVAACGPVGDFTYQINYFGDARATFQFFFPGLIPGKPFDPPPQLAEDWYEYYESSVKPVILDPANRQKLEEWVRVAKLPTDPDNWLETAENSASAVLRYAVVNLGDAAQTLGGFPFDNSGTIYRGSSSDLLLNLFVPRVAADVPALHELEDRYTTSGMLEIPLITLHTRSDEQVPYFHEVIYTLKNLREGSWLKHRLNIPIRRYGHCNFTENEAIFSFAVMLVYAGDFEVLKDIIDRLDAQSAETVERLAAEHLAAD